MARIPDNIAKEDWIPLKQLSKTERSKYTMKFYKPICGYKGCRLRRKEKEFEIYDVKTDTYFCVQQCKDKADRIERNRYGMIIFN